MTDSADEADKVSQIIIDVARLYKKPTLIQIGRCYNCDEPIRQGIFCDSECREDYERRER